MQPRALKDLLQSPWFDRAVAIIAVSPFARDFYRQIDQQTISIPQFVLAVHFGVLVITMIFRSAPVRVTVNPFFWLLTFIATYWVYLVATYYGPGVLLVDIHVIYAIEIASLLVILFARLSLGSSIGFVPAERKIITRGAYAYVRHPIYTGVFLAYLAALLSFFSWRNALITGTGTALFMVKSLIEERFLKQNPLYAEYLNQVRWRWIPWVI